MRLTHFYYSEWPGGVEEAEQVNINAKITITIILIITTIIFLIIVAWWS